MKSGGKGGQGADGGHCLSFTNPAAAAPSNYALKTETGCLALFQVRC